MPASPGRLRELAEATEPRLRLVAPFFVMPGDEATELLLIRHAQVEDGSPNEDASLTELGREQAQALAEYLAGSTIHGVYASPSNRARETGAPVAGRHGLQVEILEDLRDVDNRMPRGLAPLEALMQEFGEAEGKRRHDGMVQGGWSFNLFGGLMESSDSLRSRVAGAIDDLIAKHPGQRVVVVSHGPPVAAYIGHILGTSADFLFYPRLTSISVVLAKESRRQLHLLNAMPHFGAL
jgi:broad specificity phosphatase PhoE